MPKSRKNKRAKHNNHWKRARMVSDNIIMETRESWYDIAGGGLELKARHKSHGMPLRSVDIEAIKKLMLNWRVRVLIYCKAPDGTRYTEERELITAERCKLPELDDFFKSQKKDALQSVNHMHVFDTGFIAETLTDAERDRLRNPEAA
ncbi:hypothetical protein HCH_02857 [Hahella chejuensis KCTC 2396]|uniref:Uncharacterized protein n=1 Tax=Hahella chejuensis (strain KCTC 2396) TaxID=349521 RepID=Q2SI89_HAHCH|nr:hypothetical protein [Hahella chejuensis]ABC29635.1 hypothetical protein HCH_02857 [Hahella chejuensis KCTC 2396]